MRLRTRYGNRGNEQWQALVSADREWRESRGLPNYDKPFWYTKSGLHQQKMLMRE